MPLTVRQEALLKRTFLDYQATQAFLKNPFIIERAERLYYWDTDGKRYFDGIGGGPKLIPQDFDARIAVRGWEALGNGITEAIVALMHDSRYTPDCDPQQAWYQKQLKKIEAGLAAAQRDIGANEFCFSNAFGLADICIGMALGYLDRAYQQYDWRGKYPGLKRYGEKLFARPSFAQTVN